MGALLFVDDHGGTSPVPNYEALKSTGWKTFHMTKIALYSEDRTLHALLSSALGKNFEVFLEPDGDAMDSIAASGACDAMILDLHSREDTLQTRIDTARRLIAANIPAILMADDSLRSTAFELVRSGAFGYCRRPPSIRDNARHGPRGTTRRALTRH